MTDLAERTAYGVLSEPATLTIERTLPGPIERIWSYLTESDLRRQWLASGDMVLQVGAPFEFVWHNNELSNPPGQPPAGMPSEHRLSSTITEVDPPYRLAFAWGRSGGVSIDLRPKGNEVLLTLTHHRLPDRESTLNVSAGWHMHLDVLVARLSGSEPGPFWEGWTRLKADYEDRVPT